MLAPTRVYHTTTGITIVVTDTVNLLVGPVVLKLTHEQAAALASPLLNALLDIDDKED